MTKVFIAGSRRLSHLNAEVKRRIDTIAEKGFTGLVGNANDADKAVQRYL
jgi:adenine-specific DNA-methyltransferase